MRFTGIKGKAWEAVKASVRRREKHCYTCPSRFLESYNAQAGHFYPVALVGSNNVLSWDDRFIHLQCGNCNGKGQGMQTEYRRHLVKDYGEKVVMQFEIDRHKVNPVKDWQEVIHRFENLPLPSREVRYTY